VPVYLQKGLGMTPLQSGCTAMAATLGVIVFNLGVSAWSRRLLKRGVPVQTAQVRLLVVCALLGLRLIAPERTRQVLHGSAATDLPAMA